MRYTALKSECALKTLEALRRGDYPAEDVLVSRGAGTKSIEDRLPTLAERLVEIKAKYPERLRLRDPAGGPFEAEACPEVHRLLPFDPTMLGDYEFWIWLAVCQFRELVDWRHGGDSGRAAPANFGIGKGSDNLLYRIWLRADAGYTPTADDHYVLARLGDQDFWRSHVFKQDYGKCHALVRALLRYQFPDRSQVRPTLKIREIRELAKRLRRLHPNILFECLDDQSAYALVEREAEAAKYAVRETPGNI